MDSISRYIWGVGTHFWWYSTRVWVCEQQILLFWDRRMLISKELHFYDAWLCFCIDSKIQSTPLAKCSLFVSDGAWPYSKIQSILTWVLVLLPLILLSILFMYLICWFQWDLIPSLRPLHLLLFNFGNLVMSLYFAASFSHVIVIS